MTKIKELLERAEGDLNTELTQVALTKLRESLKNLKDGEKTLKKLKEYHNKLLESDVEDLEYLEY